MDWINPLDLVDIQSGGGFDEGRAMHFRVLWDVFPGGITDEPYICDAAVLSRLIAAFRRWRRRCESAGRKRDSSVPTATDPIGVTDILRYRPSPDHKAVTIEFETDHEFPVAAVLKPHAARQAVALLRRQIPLAARTQAAPPPKPEDPNPPRPEELEEYEEELNEYGPWGACRLTGVALYRLSQLGVICSMRSPDYDREVRLCRIDAARLPWLLVVITHYARLIDRARDEASAPGTEAESYRITRVVRCGHSWDGETLSIEFRTDHGFPLALALTPAQAARVIEDLDQAARVSAAAKRRENKTRARHAGAPSDPHT